jgi:hypothetical protein
VLEASEVDGVVDVIEAPDAQGLASPRPGSSDAFAVGRLLTWARHGQCPGMEQFRTASKGWSSDNLQTPRSLLSVSGRPLRTASAAAAAAAADTWLGNLHRERVTVHFRTATDDQRDCKGNADALFGIECAGELVAGAKERIAWAMSEVAVVAGAKDTIVRARQRGLLGG